MSTMIPGTNENSQKEAVSKSKKGGLEGVVAATTTISKVEGTAGRLIYRGYNIHDLARTISFEEVAHLLWFGHLPNQQELVTLKKNLVAQRTLPAAVVQMLSNLPTTVEPMDALRTATSAWGAMAITGKPTVEQAIAVTARFPLFLATFHRVRSGLEPLESRADLGHAAHYLY